jgi:hypothetical protein
MQNILLQLLKQLRIRRNTNSLPPDLPRSLESPLAKTSPTGLKGKKWLVLFRAPLAGFESTADTFANSQSRGPRGPAAANCLYECF